MIKAVFTDIDGTLKNSKRKVSNYTRETLKRCKDEGLQIILVSGRSRQNMLKFIEDIDVCEYIISSNGAEIYDIQKNKKIYADTIDKKQVKMLYDYVKKNNFTIKLNYEDKLAINKKNSSDDIEAFKADVEDFKTDKEILNIINNKEIVQCVIMNENIEKLKEFKRYFYENFNNLKIENESKKLKNEDLPDEESYYCDIINKDASKGRAVEKLMRELEYSIQEVVTIGDGENDISMFKVTDNSVAMGNASEYVKKFANYVTKSNDEDGLAYMLNMILDKNK